MCVCVGGLLSEPKISFSVKEVQDFLTLISPQRANVQQAPRRDLCQNPSIACLRSLAFPQAAIQRNTLEYWRSLLFRPVMASENSFDLESVLRTLGSRGVSFAKGQEVNLYILKGDTFSHIKSGDDYCRLFGCGYQRIQLNAAAQAKLETLAKNGLDFLMIAL